MAYKKQKNVNIDALIAREDFEAADETTNTASKISTLSVNDLKEGSGLFLASVRKPDFQRETADWDIDKIVRFIIIAIWPYLRVDSFPCFPGYLPLLIRYFSIKRF